MHSKKKFRGKFFSEILGIFNTKIVFVGEIGKWGLGEGGPKKLGMFFANISPLIIYTSVIFFAVKGFVLFFFFRGDEKWSLNIKGFCQVHI